MREKHVFLTHVTRWKHVFLSHFTNIFHWRFGNIIVILGVLGSGILVVDGPNYDAKKKKMEHFSALVFSLSVLLRFPAELRNMSFTGVLKKERKSRVTLIGAAFTSHPDPRKGLALGQANYGPRAICGL